MTEDLIEIVEACRAAPGVDALAVTLVRAARESADPAPALAWAAETDPTRYGREETRLRVARFLSDFSRGEEALRWLDGPAPTLCLERVRVLLALDRRGEAATLYRETVVDAPALRDPTLDEALTLTQAQDRRGASVFDLSGRRIDSNEVPPPPPAVPRQREALTFADVGGLAPVKEQIHRRIVLPFQKPSLFQRFRRKAGGGVLMYGPPGCGKTMLARATAGECGAAFLPMEIPEILDAFIGQSEKRLAGAFENARRQPPSVLFFDEIEALAARRRYGSSDHLASLVSTFLSALDGVSASNEGVLVLAATNVPWAIDPAFRRPGRFDRVIFVPPPDREARAEILRTHLKERPQAANLDLTGIAGMTPGFSGADLAGVVETATDIAIAESITGDTVSPITGAHLKAAVREARPTTEEWLASARNYAKYANEGGFYDDVLAFLARSAR